MHSNINTSPKVTIGIPVYNVERYIEKCLLSVLNQTYQNIEVLIIDDCGTDNSLKIISQISSDHPNGNLIRIINMQRNLGVSEARNTIIDHANGKYLYFVDSDDYIEPKTIELMVNQAEQYKADVVYASSIVYNEEKDRYYDCFVFSKFEVISNNDFVNLVCMDHRRHMPTLVWNTLFSMVFIMDNNLRFFGRNSEDFLFFSSYYHRVKKAVIMPDSTYNYVVREGSLMERRREGVIPVQEIRERFLVDEKMTHGCAQVKQRRIYAVHCTKVIKFKFRAVCTALRHRHRFSEMISDTEIQRTMRHPATFLEIMHFDKYRSLNVIFYIVGKIPSHFAVKLYYIMGKAMHWI